MTETSRICVKNIGKGTKEGELRQLFSKCGEVTGVKIMRRPDGTSRNFAFIGYRTAQQAQSAVKYYNNAFLGLAKLSVSLALKLGEVDSKRKPKTDGNSATTAPPKSNVKSGDVQDNAKSKPSNASAISAPVQPISKKKEKFLEISLGKRNDVVVSASASDARQDDAVMSEESSDDELENSAATGNQENSESDDNDSEDDDSSDNGFVDFADVKPVSDLDYLRSKIVKKDGKEVEKVTLVPQAAEKDGFSQGEDDESDDDDQVVQKEDEDDDDDSNIGFDDLLQGRTKPLKTRKDRMDEDPDQSQRAEGTTEMDQDEIEVPKVDSGEANANIAVPNNRLYITNLPYNVTEDEVREHFNHALGGDESVILEVHLPLSKDDRRGRGFGFIRFASLVAAETALNALHGTAFQGRVLHLSYAATQQQATARTADDMLSEGAGWSAFQKKKEEERRKLLATSNNADRNAWNATYVRSDAVMDNVASRYQTSAGDLLDVEGQQGGDVAVRMALAETQVVMDNASFLEVHGISLDHDPSQTASSSSTAVKRSNDKLLVKNLPSDASQEELEAMFSRYGALSSFSLAPSRTIGIAEFLEPTEARAAYKGLAYRRYRTVPLFLEWAPVSSGIASSKTATSSSNGNKNNNSSSNSNTKKKAEEEKATTTAETAQKPQEQTVLSDNVVPACSVFVKNLSFSTDEQGLRQHIVRLLPFALQSSLRAVVIQRKQRRTDGPLLSLGYGFVEFRDKTAALEALARMHGSVLDEHALEAQLSTKTLTAKPAAASSSSASSSTSKRPKTKLLVKNVAFQATKKEIRDLFAAHGAVKSVRLPKTMAAGGAGSGGSLRHRGFAFVDFATAQEAQNAKHALTHAHLYGRHLVIDFEDGQDNSFGGDDTDQIGEAQEALGRKRAIRDAELLGVVQNQQSKRRKQNSGAENGGDAMATDAIDNKKMRKLL